uniref:DDE-1 domain-containing protein n=1 Tax=Amphimedon queenslandica TaxID=400682 RepID=A0A1X7V0U1_AMPQE
MSVKCLPSKTLGRPPILGFKLDHLLQEKIKSMRLRGTPIGTSVVISIGTAIAKKHSYSCEAPTLRKEWAKSVFRRMCFSKRRKSKVQPHDFLELKENFLFDIKGVVEMEDIPSSLVINWDQTAVQLVPSCSWTMEKKGTKRIEVAGIDDKRQITAVFGCTLSGNFLPIQLIYQGKTTKCLPNNIDFPRDWQISFTDNHWSNEKTMIKYVKEIIIPYISEARLQLKLHSNHPALVFLRANVLSLYSNFCATTIFTMSWSHQIQPINYSHWISV